eukprot:7076943-Alexandrium_andersonii.AAC.1
MSILRARTGTKHACGPRPAPRCPRPRAHPVLLSAMILNRAADMVPGVPGGNTWTRANGRKCFRRLQRPL